MTLLTLLFSLLSGLGLGGTESGPELISRDATIRTIVADYASSPAVGCGGNCVECGIFSWYRRLYSCPIGFSCDWWDETFDCADASCPQKCVQTLNDFPVLNDGEVADLWAAVAAGDLEPVSGLLEDSGVVQLNHRRRAVQVEGCGGSIVALIPLTTDQYSQLTS